jgi:hypothetical protein
LVPQIRDVFIGVRVILELCQCLVTPDGEDLHVLVALQVNFEGLRFAIVFLGSQINLCI